VDEAHVRSLAARLQLDLSVRIRALSHGNRQKVALLQAFMHRPEVLILDEPTQGLDPLMQQAFYALLDEARETGRTVFLSSHVMPEVERVCDRVGIIREGRLVAVEDIGELKAKQLRELDVHLANHTDPRRFAAVPGVRSAEAAGDVLRLTVTGSMDPVIKELAHHEVIDVVSHEPSLEDVFLTYYGDDGPEEAGTGGD
jgi:ABC-2 type transport system ATP-binding protein